MQHALTSLLACFVLISNLSAQLLPEHAPLGGINRARRAIYEAVSRKRHELNKRPEHEPTAKEFLALHKA